MRVSRDAGRRPRPRSRISLRRWIVPETLTRKGAQLELTVWKEAMRRKRAKEKKLADAGKAREVTVSEVIAEAFGMKV